MSLIEYNGESKVIKRICELLDTMTDISFVVVQTLPTTDISTSTIYLVPKQSAGTDNIYDEYINTDGTSQGWELIGTTEIDLSNYYTKTETDDLLDEKADIGDIPTDFVPKSTGGIFEGNVEIVTANSGTGNVNSRFRLGNNKALGVLGNTRGVIQIFDQNGNYTNIFASNNANSGNIFLPKDKPTNSELAITDDIPDELSDLQDDSTHRLVTDTEKSTWNGKAELEDIDKAETDTWNLVRPPYRNTSKEYNGITWTVNGNKVTAYGTSTERSYFVFRVWTEYKTLPKSNVYRLSGSASGGSSLTYYTMVQFVDINGTTLGYAWDYGDGVDFTLMLNTAYISVIAQVEARVSIPQANPITFEPKILPVQKVDWVSNGILGAKNLNAYPYSETSHTERGVNWTDNGDGSFTANRTATNTNNSNFQCHTRTKGEKENLVLKNGTYIFSGCPSGGNSTTYAMVISRSNPNSGAYQQLGMDTGDGITLTLDGDYYSNDEVVIGITCIIGGSYNAQNLTFKPMIRLAEDTDNTWQPYAMTNKELTNVVNNVPSTQGTYTLQATRNSDGTITYSWV